MLVHAEIESYLEDRSFELFERGWNAWDKSGSSSHVLVGLLAYSAIQLHPPPKRLGGDPERQQSYEDVKQPLQKAQSGWRKVHKDNHGIKEEHVLALLLPLGISSSLLDTILLANLSSYGIARGAVAHVPYRITEQCDPKTEFERASNLVIDLAGLDKILDDQLLLIP